MIYIINTLKLHLHEDTNLNNVDDDDASFLTSWIDSAIKRKVQHLHVCCPSDGICNIPMFF